MRLYNLFWYSRRCQNLLPFEWQSNESFALSVHLHVYVMLKVVWFSNDRRRPCHSVGMRVGIDGRRNKVRVNKLGIEYVVAG